MLHVEALSRRRCPRARHAASVSDREALGLRALPHRDRRALHSRSSRFAIVQNRGHRPPHPTRCARAGRRTQRAAGSI